MRVPRSLEEILICITFLCFVLTGLIFVIEYSIVMLFVSAICFVIHVYISQRYEKTLGWW